MEWTECLKGSIEYVESHLLEKIDINKMARLVAISPFYLQKGFKVMTGITIAEYIRNRRLYLAALEILMNESKIIDLAYKYGYDSPESFTKAFGRFHGASPKQIKSDSTKIKTYLPLKISISITGGNTMDYVVEKMEAFKVIGFKRSFKHDSAYKLIPKFWDEIFSLNKKGNGEKAIREIMEKCVVGEFGVCINDENDAGDEFAYVIAGTYHGEEVPEGMVVYEIPPTEWAKFRCVGPLPGSLQTVNTKIYEEWLPGNREYEIASGINLEWYSCGDSDSKDYECGVWMPVKRK